MVFVFSLLNRYTFSQSEEERMKKIRFGTLVLILAAFPSLLGALDALSVINRTGYDIYYLYVSPETSDSWGDDVLGDDVLFDGSSFTVPLGEYSDLCRFDIKAVDSDNDSYIKWEYDVCDRSKVILTLEDLYLNEPDEGRGQDFTILNETGFTIYHIYVSPDYADDWEEDLLGADEVLLSGETFDVSFSGYGDHCVFDIKLVDDEGDSYSRWGVDLCSTSRVTFTLDDLDL